MNSTAKTLISGRNKFRALPRPGKRGVARLGFVAAIMALLLVATGCSDKKITKANVDEVTEGMAKKQVESILGQPTSIDTKDVLINKITTYVYRQGKESVTIVFKDDKVQAKQSTLSE